MNKDITTTPAETSTTETANPPQNSETTEQSALPSKSDESTGGTETTAESTAPPSPTEDPGPADTPSPEIPNNSSFEVHYIDVGQADAALVLCDGQAMLIDGGNAEDSKASPSR